MMIKLLQKDYFSFIFNLFSLQLYTHVEQYSSMLKNLNKQIMTIKNLISLRSLPTQSTLSIILALQKDNQPTLTSYTINFVHQPCPPNS